MGDLLQDVLSTRDATLPDRSFWVVAALLGAVPLVLERGFFLSAGYPYHGDALSNLFPAQHVRHALASGQLPVYTDLWYGGHYVTFNPLFKGFYPPAWPLFVPDVPMFPTVKLLLAAHYVAVPIVAFYYLDQAFDRWVAAPFAVLFVLPMALFNGHYEKVFAMPWLVLLVCQLAGLRSGEHVRRRGMIAGVAVGTMLLTGGVYFGFYGLCLAGPIAIATRDWDFVRSAAIGGMVGLPKLLFSIVPVVLLGSGRLATGQSLTLQQLIAGLAGFWLDASAAEIQTAGVVSGEGFAPIGIPAVLLALGALVGTYVRPEWFSLRTRRWVLGVATAGSLGVLLATKWSVLYQLPVVGTFRVAARAILVVAGAALLLAWFALRFVTDHRDDRAVRIGLALFLVLSLSAGGFVWNAQSGGFTRQTDVGVQVADAAVEAGCESIWIESTDGVRTPYQKPVAYELTTRAVPLQAVNYGMIGQKYSTHDADGLTFDLLLVGRELPRQERYPLTGGWSAPVRGHVDTTSFTLAGTVQTDQGPIYLYAPHGGCTPSI